MPTEQKSLLAVLRTPPYANQRAREALDAVLTGAAFEIPLTLLFMDDGVYQLLPQQDTSAIGAKNLSATLPVLPLYDVEQIYVDSDSLEARGIDTDSLILPAEALDTDGIKRLFARTDRILSF